MTEDSKAVPEVVRQALYHIIGESGGAAEVEEDGSDRDEHRYRGEGPDGAVRRQLLAVKQSEMFRDFRVTSHRVGHARARGHARERRSDQREKHGERLHEHECLARRSAAEQPGAGDNHHVTDRRRRAQCI